MQRRFKISVDGREYDVAVVEVSDDSQLLYPEPQLGTAEPALPEAPAAAPAAAAAPRPESGPGDVLCPIAGVVFSIDVAVGAEVAEGTKVITLEAMKTKTIVAADRPGKVTAIAVTAGDAVEPGQPLLTIE